MQQLTIRGFGRELAEKISDLARKEEISLNKAALRLLRRGAGLDEASPAEDVVGSSLNHLVGTWSQKEAEQMEQVEKDFEQIDAELWS